MIVLLLISLIIFCNWSFLSASSCYFNDNEWLALQNIYDSTNGIDWSFKQPYDIFGNPWNFSSIDNNPCDQEWQGLTCLQISSNCSIQTIILSNFNLSGTLPNIFNIFTDLNYLKISNNEDLSGPIPSSLGSLQSLESIFFFANSFTGFIPSSICNISSLRNLSLDSNLLNGPIPDNIGSLTHLHLLHLYANELTGTLPSSLFMLNELYDLAIHINLFTGTISTELSSMTTLQSFYFFTNQFTGSLSSSFGLLSNLEIFEFYSNYITGSIPFSFGNMTKLTYFWSYDNHMTGSLPSSLGSLVEMQGLDIYTNYYTGSIPESFGAMNRLQKFYVYQNEFTGTIPSSFVNLTSLVYIDLSSNNFVGTIPSNLFLKTNLQYISLSKNCFTGSLPNNFCLYSNLTTLSLNGLHSGAFCSKPLFPGLSDAYFLSNAFQSSIPACYFTLPKLQNLQLSGNALTGSIAHMNKITSSLVNLTLSHNRLKGTIPNQIQNRSNWITLDLSFNKLSGELATDLLADSPKAVNSTTLYLQNNRLSGSIPSLIQSLEFIDILRGNMFSCKESLGDRHLPSHDSYEPYYICGSNKTNNSFFFWLAMTGLLTIIISILYLGTMKYHYFTNEYINKRLSWIATWWFACHQIESNSQKIFLINLIQLLKNIFIYSMIMMLFCMIFLLPLYAVLSTTFGTYSHQYAWTVSMNYTSGVGPTVILFLICSFLTYVMILHPTNLLVRNISSTVEKNSSTQDTLTKPDRPTIIPNNSTNNKSSIEIETNLSNILSKTDSPTLSFNERLFLEELNLSQQENESREPSKDYEGSDLESIEIRSSVTSVSSVLLAERYLKSLTWSQYLTQYSWIIFLFIMNLVVMLTVNMVYVYYVTSNISYEIYTLITFVLSGFKLIWSQTIIMIWFSDFLRTQSPLISNEVRTSMLLYLNIFNSTLGPLIALAFIDTDCFYYLIRNPREIITYRSSTNYKITEDSNYIPIGTSLIITSKFLPPFIYSYQCSSALFSNYSNVIIYRYIISGLFLSLLQLWNLFRIQKRHEIVKNNSNQDVSPSQSPPVITPSVEHRESVFNLFNWITVMRTMRPSLLNSRPSELTNPATDQHNKNSMINSNVSIVSNPLNSTVNTTGRDFSLSIENSQPLENDNNTNSLGSTGNKQSTNFCCCWDISSWKERMANNYAYLIFYLTGYEKNKIQENTLQFFTVERMIILLLSDLSILLTFGVIFPPTSVVIVFSIIIESALIFLKIGRIIYLSQEDSQFVKQLININHDCKHIVTLVTRLFPIMGFSVTIVWSIVLFDILGDSVGIRALAVFIPMFLLPWIFNFTEKFVVYMYSLRQHCVNVKH